MLSKPNKLLAFLLLFALPLSVFAAAEAEPFSAWLQALKVEAKSRGISEPTLQAALTDIQPIKRVIELDRKQPEFTQTFLNYLNKRVTLAGQILI